MLGYTERFTDLLEDKRDKDLSVGKHYREMIVWANTVGKSTFIAIATPSSSIQPILLCVIY